jgi:hypothetical protein
MGYLADSLLVVADCSGFSTRAREDLFMNSRDRLSEGELRKKLEDALTAHLSEHPGLRRLREERRRKELEEKVGNDRPLADAIEEIFRHSPSLSSLFLDGMRVTSPFRTTDVSTEEGEFKGQRFPTYFKFKGVDYGTELSRDCHVTSRCRILFETDAENEYLDRRVDPGRFELRVVDELSHGRVYNEYVLNLRNGAASLSITLPESVRVGDRLAFVAELTDRTRMEPFSNAFSLQVLPEITTTGGPGRRGDPPSNKKGQERERESKLQLPKVIEVGRNDYERYGFTEQTALTIKDTGEGGRGEKGAPAGAIYDFFVNIDNVYLAQELKTTRLDAEVLRQQFKVGLVLVGLALIHADRNLSAESAGEPQPPIDERVSSLTAAVAPVLLPMIRALGAMDAVPAA